MKGRKNEKELERAFKSFANRRRIAIVSFLKGRKEASVGDIAQEIKLSFKATSRHLSVLVSAGVLDRDQRSSHMFYRISTEIPEAAKRMLAIL
jgi:ArsR family transcriptional regulator, arsenate/arsenite/antimonite-responsive transcriptional repressor